MVGAFVRRAVCAVAVMCAVVGAARAWGDTGHQLTAQVATAFLTSEAKSEANTILQGQTLQDVVTWADSVRTQPGFEWSGVLHYVNTPSWACTYDSGDCPDNMCVVGAIQNYSTRLQKEAAGGEQQLEAFKFLIHFCGDIHQPLHVAFAADRGGNDIYGEFLGQHGSLHGDWDYNIISNRITNDFSGSQDDYGNYLIQQIQSGDYANNNWTQCDSGRGSGSNSGSNSWLCPAEWASITANLACNYAYVDEYGNRIQQNFDLDEGYQTNTQGIVDMQLAKSGVRMAFALNKILGAMHADRMARQGGHDAAHHHRHHGK